jgi:ubiquinone/menaquinone biosynthesis C-methylase UbiE
MTISRFAARRTHALLLVTLFVPATGWARQAAIGAEKIFTAIEARDGATICEMGAGDGELTIAAAKIVGTSGRVFTSELGTTRVQALRDKVAASQLAQVTVVAGDAARTNFPDAACDAIFMRNVYHHFADPPAMNAAIAAALKPGGRLAVVEFGPPPGNEASCPGDRGKDNMHGITPATLARELKDAGFEPILSDSGTGRTFIVVVARPKS